MLASLCGAIATLLLALTPDQRLRGAIFWLVGDLSGAQGGLGCGAAALVFAAWLSWRGQAIDRLLLGSEVAALLKNPEMRERMAAEGFETGDTGAAHLREVMQRDIVKWSKVVKEANIKVAQ